MSTQHVDIEHHQGLWCGTQDMTIMMAAKHRSLTGCAEVSTADDLSPILESLQ